MARWLAALLYLSSLSGAATTYVIAAGVEKYDDERISSLTYAVADATAVAQTFRASGVARPNVIQLTSDEKDPARRPTRIGLLTALQTVAGKAEAGDRLVFFFAGHGIEKDGQQYLLTVDTRIGLIEDTALPLRLVNKALAGIQASEILFLLDACRNDPQKGRGEADASLSDGLARGMRPVITPPAGATKPRLVATLLACEVGQRAWEDPDSNHGAFTASLLKGLGGKAAEANREVKLSALAKHVIDETGKWAARHGKQQTPHLVNPDGGDMVVVTVPAEPLVSVAFENTTLARVVQILAEQYGAQVILGQGVDPEAKVNGRLDNLPLATMLKVLLAAYGLNVRREGKIHVIDTATAVQPTPQPRATGRAEPEAGTVWVNPKDGIEFVYVPSGPFVMGTDDGLKEEGPRHTVELRGFWIGKNDVTEGQYGRFAKAVGRPPLPSGGDQFPVVGVSHEAATSYCRWAGTRLPTEAEWEKAARGTDGRLYPWGNDWDPDLCSNSQSGSGRRMPVGSFPAGASPYGCLDMVGNVSQWVASICRPYPYRAEDGREDANSPDPRVCRGRGWACSWPTDAPRVTRRGGNWPTAVDQALGFRCAVSVDRVRLLGGTLRPPERATAGDRLGDRLLSRLLREHTRLASLCQPEATVGAEGVQTQVYPTWARASNGAGILTVDVGGGLSFVCDSPQWGRLAIDRAAGKSGPLQVDQHLLESCHRKTLDLFKDVLGESPWPGARETVKYETLLTGEVGTTVSRETSGRILVRWNRPQSQQCFQVLWAPDGRLLRLDTSVPVVLTRWLAYHAGQPLSQSPAKGVRAGEPPLRLGTFYAPLEYRFEMTAYSCEGEPFVDLRTAANPVTPQPFDLSRPEHVDRRALHESSSYRFSVFELWHRYGRVNAWRGNCTLTNGREEWEYPQHTVAFHKAFTDYELVGGMPTQLRDYIVDGETMKFPFGSSKDPEARFFEDLDSCHVAFLSTHMGSIDGVFQFARCRDIWLRLNPPGNALGADRLRHLFLLGCAGTLHYTGPASGAGELLVQYWQKSPPVGGVRTVSGFDGEFVGLFRDGWMFFGYYNKGASVADAFALAEIDECDGNNPVTLAYGANESEAFETLLYGRFTDRPAACRHMVASVWRQVSNPPQP